MIRPQIRKKQSVILDLSFPMLYSQRHATLRPQVDWNTIYRDKITSKIQLPISLSVYWEIQFFMRARVTDMRNLIQSGIR